MAKYEQWLNYDGLLLIGGWAKDGLTKEEIAQKMGISPSTLYEWCNKYSEISEAIKKNNEIVDREVENSLFKKTQGYNVKVQKTFKLKEAIYNDDGRKIAERERLEVGFDEIYIQADTMAMMYWLNNRKRDKWTQRPTAIDENQAALETVDKVIVSIRNARVKEDDE